MLESTTQYGKELGIFPETPVDNRRTGDVVEPIVTSDSGRYNANRNSNTNSNVFKQGIMEQSDCERNIVYRKFSISDEKIKLNWTSGDVELSSGRSFVNFR